MTRQLSRRHLKSSVTWVTGSDEPKSILVDVNQLKSGVCLLPHAHMQCLKNTLRFVSCGRFETMLVSWLLTSTVSGVLHIRGFSLAYNILFAFSRICWRPLDEFRLESNSTNAGFRLILSDHFVVIFIVDHDDFLWCIYLHFILRCHLRFLLFGAGGAAAFLTTGALIPSITIITSGTVYDGC